MSKRYQRVTFYLLLSVATAGIFAWLFGPLWGSVTPIIVLFAAFALDGEMSRLSIQRELLGYYAAAFLLLAVVTTLWGARLGVLAFVATLPVQVIIGIRWIRRGTDAP